MLWENAGTTFHCSADTHTVEVYGEDEPDARYYDTLDYEGFRHGVR